MLRPGELASAASHFAEFNEISYAQNNAMGPVMDHPLPALQGDAEQTLAKATTIIAVGAEIGLGTGAVRAHQSLALLHLGASRYETALDHLRALFQQDPVLGGNEILHDMVEAAVRAGHRGPRCSPWSGWLSERRPRAGLGRWDCWRAAEPRRGRRRRGDLVP